MSLITRKIRIDAKQVAAIIGCSRKTVLNGGTGTAQLTRIRNGSKQVRFILEEVQALAKLAKINYGRANGFTCHSFRHTFVTDMMKATGNDVGLVMSYSGHRSLESFRGYLHPTREGSILAKQRLNSVG